MKALSINGLIIATALAVTGGLATFEAAAADVEKLVEECA